MPEHNLRGAVKNPAAPKLRIIIIAVTILTLAVISSITAFILARPPEIREEFDGVDGADSDGAGSFRIPAGNEFSVHPENLMLPDIPSELWRGVYMPVRRRKTQWGMDELKQFYYDPREIAAENLRAINQKKIDALLNMYR